MLNVFDCYLCLCVVKVDNSDVDRSASNWEDFCSISCCNSVLAGNWSVVCKYAPIWSYVTWAAAVHAPTLHGTYEGFLNCCPCVWAWLRVWKLRWCFHLVGWRPRPWLRFRTLAFFSTSRGEAIFDRMPILMTILTVLISDLMLLSDLLATFIATYLISSSRECGLSI